MKQRIAITGMGAVTPLGNSVPQTWEALIQGRSGIGPISYFDASGLPCRIAGQIKDFSPESRIPPKLLRRLDPFAVYALSACNEAASQAGLDNPSWDRERAGVVIGSSRGGVSTLESHGKKYRDRGFRGLPPYFALSSLLNQAPAMISQHYGILGPCFAVSTACASGAHAVGEAVRTLRSGDADLILTGGAEAPITPLVIGGFAKVRALSRRNHEPSQACRPFDLHRDGFVVSEGAAIMVLETWEHAEARGAKILGEIQGFGMSSDAYHMTAPDPEGVGMARAMQLAMKDAGIGPDEVGLFNAHGTGTRQNDRIETLALCKALGARAQEIPVCALKSMTGHLLGAGGALEAVMSIQMIRQGLIPPIRNLETPDPDCRLDFVRGEALRQKITSVLSTSFAFGGANAALILKGN